MNKIRKRDSVLGAAFKGEGQIVTPPGIAFEIYRWNSKTTMLEIGFNPFRHPKAEGNQAVTNCNVLKMTAAEGKNGLPVLIKI